MVDTLVDLLLPAGTEQLSSEEEGEIIELDDDDNNNDDEGATLVDGDDGPIHLSFEDISSDEELNLRQRIEELEARNQELEQIAAISKTTAADYAPVDAAAAAADLAYIDLVDDSSPERSNLPSATAAESKRICDYHSTHRHHRSRLIPRSRSRSPRINRTSTTTASHRQRHHHHHHHHHPHHTKSDHPSEPLQRSRANSSDADHERLQRVRSQKHRCRIHRTKSGRRSSTELAADSHRRSDKLAPHNAHHHQQHHHHRSESPPPTRQQPLSRTAARRRPIGHKPDRARRSRSPSTSGLSRSSSSTSDISISSSESSLKASAAAAAARSPLHHYRPDRHTLQAALKRDIGRRPSARAPSPPQSQNHSLQRKLLGIQQSVKQYMVAAADEAAAAAAAIRPEEQITAAMTTTSSASKSSTGSDFAVADAAEEASASIEIMALLDTLTDEHLIAADETAPSTSASDMRRTMSPILVDSPLDDKSQQQLEAILLEEQELRLAALKSAILKKHEARKKRKVLEARPYSPTDEDIVLDGPTVKKPSTEAQLLDLIVAENEPNDVPLESQNMEISPMHSPGAWQLDDGDRMQVLQSPVDMELSDGGSASPEYPEEEVDRLADFHQEQEPHSADIRSFGMFQQQNRTLVVCSTEPEPVSSSMSLSSSSSSSTSLPTPPPPPLDASVLAAARQQRLAAAAEVPLVSEVKAAVQPTEEDDEEAALRALLLATSRPRKRPAVAKVPLAVPDEAIVKNEPPTVDKSATCSNDDDADALRLIVMQTLASRSSNHSIETVQKENQPTLEASQLPEPIAVASKPQAISANILHETNHQQPTAAPDAAVTSRPPATAPAPAKPSLSPTKAAAIAIKRKAIAIANVPPRKLRSLAVSVSRTPTPTSSAYPSPSGSALITYLPQRTVQPLIIRCNPSSSDSDSDEWAADGIDANEPLFGNRDWSVLSRPSSAVGFDRFGFDPASPASCPVGGPDDTNSNSTSSRGLTAAAAALASVSTLSPLAPPFEQKVDEYLRRVRQTIQQSVVKATEEDASKKTEEGVQKTEVLSTPIRKSAAVGAKTKPTKMMVTTQAGPATPLVVRHLPLSSQAEYKQLVLRMSLLEQKRTKQKELQQKRVAAAPKAKPVVKVVEAEVTESVQRVEEEVPKQEATAIEENRREAKTDIDSTSNEVVEQVDISVNSTKTPDLLVKTETVTSPSVDSPTVSIEAVSTPSSIESEQKIKAAKDKQILADIETNYQRKSSLLLAAVQRQHQRLGQAIKVRTKQLLLERQRRRLLAQLERCDRELAAERGAFKPLCVSIVAAQKQMRVERSECLQLVQRCDRLGGSAMAAGTAAVYALPDNDRMAQIERDFALVNDRTQRLKALRTDSQLNDVASKTDTKQPSMSSASRSKPAEAPPATEDSKTTVPDAAADVPKSAESPTKPTPAATDVVPSSTEATTIEATIEQPSMTEEATASPDSTATLPPLLSKYTSPLDTINNDADSSQTATSTANISCSSSRLVVVDPNGVLCPFELQGRCDDTDCQYQHLNSEQ